jgi:YVTN family beta-propeller protein
MAVPPRVHPTGQRSAGVDRRAAVAIACADDTPCARDAGADCAARLLADPWDPMVTALMKSIGILLVATIVVATGCHHRTSGTDARVFVSNENDGTVSVIDANAGRVIATIPVGKRPRGLHVSRDGQTLYVALSGSPKAGPGVDESTLPPPDRGADGIGVVDLKTLKLVRTIASGPDPESFDLTGDGESAIVSNEDNAEASIVDLGAGTIRARVAVGREPEGVATHPGGDIYVTSEADARITVIDPAAARVIATIPTGPRPRAIAFAHDGARAFVTDETDGTITMIDARAHTVARTIALPREGSSPIGPRPMGIATSRDGDHVYVTTGRGGSVAILDADSGDVERVIAEVGPRPWGIAVAPDERLYTANGSSNDVSVIDPDEGRVVTRIAVGGSPWGVAIDR